MSTINLDKLSTLAQIDINEEDRDNLQRDIDAIFQLIEKIQTIDTATLTPLSHPLEIQQILHEDICSDLPNRDSIQQCSAQIDKHMYITPKVV